MINDGCLYFHEHFPMAIKILKFISSFSFLGCALQMDFTLKSLNLLNFELESNSLESQLVIVCDFKDLMDHFGTMKNMQKITNTMNVIILAKV